MRVLVCGGRAFRNRTMLDTVLDDLAERKPITLVIEGDADGADRLAGAWAYERDIALQVYPAGWSRHGRGAGPIRNKQMIVEGMPDLVVAFPGGRGTANMVRQAKAAGVPVISVDCRQTPCEPSAV